MALYTKQIPCHVLCQRLSLSINHYEPQLKAVTMHDLA